ncbi:MAG: response regulator [bacterium]
MKNNYNWQEYTILIAEDERISLNYLRALLKKTKVNVIHSNDGVATFVECLKNEKIDLVLMDIKMLGINGLEATKLIKKYRPSIPIIAQTAYAQVGDCERCLLFGCDDYVAKPFLANEILEKIDRLLKKVEK